MNRTLERLYPVGAGVIVGVMTFYFVDSFKEITNQKDIMAASVNIGAISVGFLATALTMILALADKEIIRKLKASRYGYYDSLLSYLKEAIIWALFVAVFSIVGIYLSENTEITGRIFFATWSLVMIACLLAMYRVLSIFIVILRD